MPNVSHYIIGAVVGLGGVLFLLIVAPILGTLGGATNIQAEIANLTNNGYVVQAANGDVSVTGNLTVGGTTGLSNTLQMNSNCILLGTAANGGPRFCRGGAELAILRDSTNARGINFTLTAAGNQTIAASAGNLVLTSPYVLDDVLFRLGTDGDVVVKLTSAVVAADAEPDAALYKGTSDHQGTAADSLVLSNGTADGDIQGLVNNGGNSLEWLLVDTSAKTITLGWGGFNTTFYAASGAPLRSYQNQDAASVQVGVFETDRATPAVGDAHYISHLLSNAAGAQTEYMRWTYDTVNGEQGDVEGRTVLSFQANGTLGKGVLTINDPATTLNGALVYRRQDGGGALGVIRIGTLSGGAHVGSPTLFAASARGTIAAPTATLSGDLLGDISLAGHTGTDWIQGAYFQASALENWSTSARGTKLVLTMPASTTTLDTARHGWSDAIEWVDDNFGLVIGASAKVASVGADIPEFQVLGNDASASDATALIGRWGNNANGPFLYFTKSRHATVGSNAIVTTGDTLGAIAVLPDDGVDFKTYGGYIIWRANGTIAENRVPTDMHIYLDPGGADNAVRMTATFTATGNFALKGGATTPALDGAAADIVSIAGVDFAVGDRRLYIQSETGSPVIIGGNQVRTGLAGTATGSFVMSGATSGVVTLTVAAAAGTWTMTLPTGVAGVGGYQLTDAAGDGVTSWTAAASRREWKQDIADFTDYRGALDRILASPLHTFKYRSGYGTGDYDTTYLGIMADESPWATHFSESIINPVNTLGYMVAGFKAHEDEITSLNSRLAALEDRLTELEKAVLKD